MAMKKRRYGLYRKFLDGLVMNNYNELIKNQEMVLFTPSYSMSGVRGAVNIIVWCVILSVLFLPSPISAFFMWLALCAYTYKGAVESKMGSGYPHLEALAAVGLAIYYLIYIPVAAIIYFVIGLGYAYLAGDYLGLEFLESLFLRVFVLIALWLFYMLLIRETKWDRQNAQSIQDFKTIESNSKLEEEKEAQTNGSYDDFVKKLKKLNRTKKLKGKFKLPKGIKDIEDIKKPVFSDKRLTEFVEWVRQVSKDQNRKVDLANLLTENKKLSVNLPALRIYISPVNKTSGSIYFPLLDQDHVSSYKVLETESIHTREFDNKKWVDIINNPMVSSAVIEQIFEDEELVYIWDSISDESVYLEAEDLYIPYEEEFKDFYDEEYLDPTAYNEYNLYSRLKVEFWGKDISINGNNFSFKKNEKDYLLTLLVTSYRPNLLKRIKKYLEDK